jgi:hypothetical protein
MREKTIHGKITGAECYKEYTGKEWYENTLEREVLKLQTKIKRLESILMTIGALAEAGELYIQEEE